MLPSTANFLELFDLMRADNHPAVTLLQPGIPLEKQHEIFAARSLGLPAPLADLYQHHNGQGWEAGGQRTNASAFFVGLWLGYMGGDYDMMDEYEVSVEAGQRNPDWLPFLYADGNDYSLDMTVENSPVYYQAWAGEGYAAFDNFLTFSETLLAIYRGRLDEEATLQAYRALNPNGQREGRDKGLDFDLAFRFGV